MLGVLLGDMMATCETANERFAVDRPWFTHFGKRRLHTLGTCLTHSSMNVVQVLSREPDTRHLVATITEIRIPVPPNGCELR